MTTPKKAQDTRGLVQTDPLNSSLLASHRQCPATSKRTGEQCKNFCSVGARTCRWHGSATRKAKTAAAKRIAEASGYAAEMLVEFMADPAVDVKTRTLIAQDLLTRAGVTGKQQLEVKVERNWEDVMESVLIDVSGEDIEDVPAVESAEVADPEERERERRRRRKAGLPSEERERPTGTQPTRAQIERLSRERQERTNAPLSPQGEALRREQAQRKTFAKDGPRVSRAGHDQ